MKSSKILTALLALSMVASPAANAQLNLGNMLNKAKNEATRKVKQSAETSAHQAASKAKMKARDAAKDAARNAGTKLARGLTTSSGGEYINNGTVYYVSPTGSKKNDGLSPEKPFKNLQHAIDQAKDGAVIMVAEGNYLGTFDVGYIEIKDKYLSLVGGWSTDFSERDPYTYITRIQPGENCVETNGSKALLEIEARRWGNILIDGFGFDLGYQNLYAAPNSDERNGWPEGCETGRIQAVGEGLGANGSVGGSTQSHQLIHGVVKGNVYIRNCVFANGGYYGVQMMNMEGNWEISNNVFVANSYASCQIDSMNKDANTTSVDFFNNTVLFTWCRTKIMEDMGYAFRFMSRMDANVHDNIFGCSNLGALDYTHQDSNKAIEAKRKVSLRDNQFFMNKGDLILPSASYKWLYIRCDQFDEVDEELFDDEGNNVEMTDLNFIKAISQPYLNGFAGIEVMQSSNFNRNSAANQVREALGLNMRGTETVRVSMYGNRYPFEEAYKLFGALEGCGAQLTF